MNTIEFLEKNLERQLSWISTAETRGAFVFAMTVPMLGVIAAAAPLEASEWTVGQAVPAAIACLLEGVAILFLSIGSFPRTTGPRGSIVFFGGISDMSKNQFVARMDELTEEEYLADLAGQCHRNAEIAAIKFKWVQRALIALYISILPWSIALYLLYNSA